MVLYQAGASDIAQSHKAIDSVGARTPMKSPASSLQGFIVDVTEPGGAIDTDGWQATRASLVEASAIASP
jgi:hypothetical protein